MNYGMLVSNLTSSRSNQPELKAPPKNPDKSFGNWYETEKAKSRPDRNYKDNEDAKKLRVSEKRQDDTKDYLKADKNSENNRNDKIKLDKQREEENQRVRKNEKTLENEKTEESNKAGENGKIEDGNNTEENKTEKSRKCEKESEKSSVGEDDKEKSKDKVRKDIEDVLDKIAQLTGISVEKLKDIIGLQNINTDKGNEIKVDEVIKKLSGLIDDKSKGNEQFLKQIEGLLKELDVKTSTNTEKIKDQNVKGINKEEIENKSVQTIKDEETKIGLDVENKEPIKTQEKKVNTQLNDNTTENINTDNKSVKQKTAGGEQGNSSNDNSETESEDSSGLKEKVKIDIKTVDKSESSFKVAEQNIIQVSKETNDVKTELPEIETRITNKATRDEIIKQFIDKASVSMTGDKTEMVINLKPDHLGKLSLKVATENGIVTAQMVAENQQVKEIIETNLNVLRDALEKQGIAVQQFNVSVGQDSWKREFDNNESKNLPNSNNKKQGARVSTVSGFGYLGGQQTINNQIWPDSTINFIA